MYCILDFGFLGVAGFVLGIISTVSTWQALGFLGCLLVVILSGTSLWLKRGQARGYFLLESLNAIPSSEAGNAEWFRWGVHMKSLLIGMGMPEKADILKELIGATDIPGRPKAAENFIRGLALDLGVKSKSIYPR